MCELQYLKCSNPNILHFLIKVHKFHRVARRLGSQLFGCGEFSCIIQKANLKRESWTNTNGNEVY